MEAKGGATPSFKEVILCFFAKKILQFEEMEDFLTYAKINN